MVIVERAVRLGVNQKLVMVPIGDIHYNAEACDRENFHQVLKWVEATAQRKDREVVTFLMGDYLDTFSRSERLNLQWGKGFHDTSMAWMDLQVMAAIEQLAMVLKPVASTIGCVVAGNHTYKFQSCGVGRYTNWTSDQVLADILGVPFVGMCGVVVLKIYRGKATQFTPFKVFMHHGFGATGTKQASIKQVLDLRQKFPMFNLYIMGHNHIKICTTMQGIDVKFNSREGRWRMVEVVQGFVRSASFLKGYVEGQAVDGYSGSYVEEKCLTPAGLGVVSASLRWALASRSPKTPNRPSYKLVLHVQE